MLKRNVIRVPEGCSTMHQAMELAVIFSERNECTRENPVQIQVGEGEHEMVGVADWSGSSRHHTQVSCNNITIVGKGKGKTTILGGFYVNGNGCSQNVKMEELTATNTHGIGLYCQGIGAIVDVTECCFQKCGHGGMGVVRGAIVVATRCDFMENSHLGVACTDANTKLRLNDSTIHHNGMEGLYAEDHAVVDLHGTTTGVHSNKGDGIYAIDNAKVNIHLLSQHNTSHDNVGNNRFQQDGGSIANMNDNGTFTHAEEVEFDEGDY